MNENGNTPLLSMMCVTPKPHITVEVWHPAALAEWTGHTLYATVRATNAAGLSSLLCSDGMHIVAAETTSHFVCLASTGTMGSVL
jgi:hypothetical protein